MNLFKLFWDFHRWVGITVAVVLICTATTGFMLLVKKRVPWIQPPTQTGTAGDTTDFISIDAAVQTALALNLPELQSATDVDRIDVRPQRRLYKIRSVEGHREVQVDAVSGEVLSSGVRRSDLIESLHDGSFFGGFAHDWVMPAVALAVLFLVFSGLWIWLSPKVRRWQKKKPQSASENGPPAE